MKNKHHSVFQAFLYEKSMMHHTQTRVSNSGSPSINVVFLLDFSKEFPDFPFRLLTLVAPNRES